MIVLRIQFCSIAFLLIQEQKRNKLLLKQHEGKVLAPALSKQTVLGGNIAATAQLLQLPMQL